ncbi:hypothetical protein DFH88_004457 [Clostridium saccharobutylicum]|nr:hypothetical protein [Clostridium saccharobutylicum]NOV95343.1 hypothetical protein [Clostridium saccharobutylicum]
MLNRAAMLSRIDNAVKYNIPIVNYGVLIRIVPRNFRKSA